jgi:hypothetical protein
MPSAENTAELEALLDQASYQLTSARTAGLTNIDDLREALKKVRALMQDADALASSVEAARRDTDTF